MHPAWTVDLATQHAAQLQAVAATWRRGIAAAASLIAAAASLIAAPNALANHPPNRSPSGQAGL